MADLGDFLLRDALRERASDIHMDPLTTGYRIRLRVDGAVYDASLTDLPLGERMVRHFRALSGMETGHLMHPVDGRQTYRLDGHEVDLRLAFAPTASGEKLTIRVLDRTTARRDAVGAISALRAIGGGPAYSRCGIWMLTIIVRYSTAPTNTPSGSGWRNGASLACSTTALPRPTAGSPAWKSSK